MILALAAAGALLWALRGPRMWALWLLALGPVVAVHVLSPESRVYSYHGFLHQSLVYQLLENGAPPINPLLAGEIARYTWGPHYLIALACRVGGVSPSWLFASMNILALALSVIFLYRVGLCLCGDRRAAVLGVTISLFGISVTHLLGRLWKALEVIEPLAMPPAEKFTNLNATPLGILFSSMFVLAVARLTEPDGRRIVQGQVLLLLSVVGAGFMYPLLWVGILAGGAGAVVWLLIRPGTLPRGRLWRAAGVAGIGMMITVPYLLSVGQAGTAEGTLRLAGPRHYATYLFNFVALGLPAAVLIALGRKEIRSALAGRRELFQALAVVAMVHLALSLGIRGPVVPGIEYKYRMVSLLIVGVVAGIGVETLRRRRPRLAFAALAILLLPIVDNARYKVMTRFAPGVADPFHEEGTWIRHADPVEDELYGWIAAETPSGAAFVDDRLTIPVFARRALYVGLDNRRRASQRSAPGRPWLDGWGMTAETMIPDVLGAARDEVAPRIETARAVLAGERLDRVAGEFERVMERSTIQELYVVLRDPEIARRFDGNPRFAPVFENDRARVLRFRRHP